MYTDPTGYADAKITDLAKASNGSAKWNASDSSVTVTINGTSVKFGYNDFKLENGSAIIDNEKFNSKINSKQQDVRVKSYIDNKTGKIVCTTEYRNASAVTKQVNNTYKPEKKVTDISVAGFRQAEEISKTTTYQGTDNPTMADILSANPQWNKSNWDDSQKYYSAWLYGTHSVDQIADLENSSYVLAYIKVKKIDASKLTVADMDNIYKTANSIGFKAKSAVMVGAAAYGMYGRGAAVEGAIKTPNVNTKVINAPEVKAPNAIKSSEVTNRWNSYLGENTTNINPRTGQVDPNRIFSADGTKSVRFDSHEMNSMGTPKFHYHEETWTYDAVNDTMTVTNTLQRIK